MDYFEREERRRRIVGWIMFAGLVLLIVFGCMRNCRKGIDTAYGFLYRRSEMLYSSGNAQIVVSRESESALCELTYNGESCSAAVEQTGGTLYGNPEYQIAFEDGVIVTGFRANDGSFYNPDWPLESHISVTVGDQIDLSDEMAAQLMMKAAFGEVESNGSGWLVFFGALIYGLGMLFWLFPEQMHELGNIKNIMYQDASLTADGEVMVQVSGILVMIIGALLALRLFPGI